MNTSINKLVAEAMDGFDSQIERAVREMVKEKVQAALGRALGDLAPAPESKRKATARKIKGTRISIGETKHDRTVIAAAGRTKSGVRKVKVRCSQGHEGEVNVHTWRTSGCSPCAAAKSNTEAIMQVYEVILSGIASHMNQLNIGTIRGSAAQVASTCALGYDQRVVGGALGSLAKGKFVSRAPALRLLTAHLEGGIWTIQRAVG